ncbi:MAG: flagellar basal body P-ring formation chaperone FlgA [Candidatus Scalindua sp.]|nr:flagellar basal body P-ring formation chaperone FlgA [Candidatus Scalindua sp.]
MKSRVFVCVVITFLVVMGSAQASQIEIDIMDKVTLKEKIITIGDISQVTGDDDKLIKIINDIEVGRTPWPNNHRRVDRDFFKMRLLSSGISLSDIVFEGSEAAIVSVESTKITGTEIVEKAKEHLLFATQSFNRDITIEVGNNPGDQWVTKKRDEIYLDASLADISKNRGNVVVMVMANADGVLLFKIPVRFKVRVFEFIAIAKNKIDRHKSLTAENVFLARRETTNVNGEIFSDVESLRGKVASTQILPFTVITEEIIETPPTIKKGDTVKLFIKTEKFKIVTKGLAQENGVTGEIIKVQNFDTKKVLHGRIVDYENVQILF